MLLIIRKNSIFLIAIVFICTILLYSFSSYKNNYIPVSGEKIVEKTVVVDAGHGGVDPGAVSAYSGALEKEINLKIAYLVKDILEINGYNVVLTRTEDKLHYKNNTNKIIKKRQEDLAYRKSIIDKNNNGIAISIHLNKFEQEQYSGAQVFYPKGSEESIVLANIIQDSFKENLDSNNDRKALVKKDKMYLFENLKTPTVLVECGFLSNEAEEKRLLTDEYCEEVAKSIAIGINNYYKK